MGRRRLAARQLVAHLAEQPEALGDDVVLVDLLEVLLAGGDERRVGQRGKALDDAADHLAHAVLDEARAAMRLLDDGRLVAALHQLVDLRGHRPLDDVEQRARFDLVLALLGAADVERAEAALVVRRDGDVLEDPLDLVVGEAVGGEALARSACDQLLRAGAGRHALSGDADEPARAALGGDRRAVERVDLLGRDAGGGRRLVLGVARGDRDLGALALLAVADALGDVRGERLGLEGLAEDDLVDRLVDDLLEARHVRALLLRAEVDEALELGIEERAPPIRLDPDDLLDARHAYAREADAGAWTAGLDVASEERGGLVHGDRQLYLQGHWGKTHEGV